MSNEIKNIALKRYYSTQSGKIARYRNRKKYYDRTKHLTMGKRRWSNDEIELLLDFNETDEQLAYKLNRSVSAIQVKRCRLLKEESLICD